MSVSRDRQGWPIGSPRRRDPQQSTTVQLASPRLNGVIVKYRIRLVRTQMAERFVRAVDEGAALEKVKQELATASLLRCLVPLGRPYGERQGQVSAAASAGSSTQSPSTCSMMPVTTPTPLGGPVLGRMRTARAPST